jgi:hypothetical protein
MRPELVLKGVIPANLMAFDSELEIDEAHVRPPLRRIPDAEREEIRRVVTAAGLPAGRGGRPTTPPSASAFWPFRPRRSGRRSSRTSVLRG